MQPTSVSRGPPTPPEGPIGGWWGQWQLLGGEVQVGPSLEVPTAWRLSTGMSSLPPALSLPFAMSLVTWRLVPQPQALEDKVGMRSLHHHHYTHTHTHTHTHTYTYTLSLSLSLSLSHTHTHPNQLAAREVGRVQKEVSKEGQEGVKEKSLQCGVRWGENGKGLRGCRGWGQAEKGLRVHPGCRVSSCWGRVTGNRKTSIK